MPRPKKLDTAVVRKAIAAKPSIDSASLLNDLIDVWGGTRQFASDLYTEFRGAQKGSVVRQRILEMLQRLVIVNTQTELSRSSNPEDLDEADLDKMISRYLVKLQENQPPDPLGAPK